MNLGIQFLSVMFNKLDCGKTTCEIPVRQDWNAGRAMVHKRGESVRRNIQRLNGAKQIKDAAAGTNYLDEVKQQAD